MIAARGFLHPALRRLWWQSSLGWLKRMASLLATPGGLVLAFAFLIFFFEVFRDGLRLSKPWIETVDPKGLVSMVVFAVAGPCAVAFTWLRAADSALFNTPLSRKEILLFTLLRRLAITAFCCAPLATLLDSHFYLDLFVRLVGFGSFLVSGAMLLQYFLSALPPKARAAAELLLFSPLLAGASLILLLVGLRLAGLDPVRFALRNYLINLQLNRPFALFMDWAATPGWAGALIVAGSFLAGAALFSTLLLRFFEPHPEPTEEKGLIKLFLRERKARGGALPALPRMAGAGPVIRVQLIGAARNPALFVLVLIAQLPMLESTSTGRQPGPTSLSLVLFLASAYAFLIESNLKKMLIDHLERFKALPLDPRPLLAASLVVPVLGAFALATLSLLPSLILFPAATLALPFGKFFFTFVPLVIFVTAAAQTIILTLHQQLQRLLLAKRWYQEAAYVVSLVLAFFVALFLFFLIVAPTIGWREAAWSMSAVVALLQLVGTALMFWYARVSYGLIEVVSHEH